MEKLSLLLSETRNKKRNLLKKDTAEYVYAFVIYFNKTIWLFLTLLHVKNGKCNGTSFLIRGKCERTFIWYIYIMVSVYRHRYLVEFSNVLEGSVRVRVRFLENSGMFWNVLENSRISSCGLY